MSLSVRARLVLWTSLVVHLSVLQPLCQCVLTDDPPPGVAMHCGSGSPPVVEARFDTSERGSWKEVWARFQHTTVKPSRIIVVATGQGEGFGGLTDAISDSVVLTHLDFDDEGIEVLSQLGKEAQRGDTLVITNDLEAVELCLSAGLWSPGLEETGGAAKADFSLDRVVPVSYFEGPLQPQVLVHAVVAWGVLYRKNIGEDARTTAGGLNYQRARMYLEEQFLLVDQSYGADNALTDAIRETSPGEVKRLVAQVVITTTDVSFADFEEGLKRTMTLVRDIIPAGEPFVYVVLDRPGKSNCWVTSWMQHHAQLSPELWPSAEHTVTLPDLIAYLRWSHERGRPIKYVVVTDDNSCSGNQMIGHDTDAHHEEKILVKIINGFNTDHYVWKLGNIGPAMPAPHVIIAPLFSTAGLVKQATMFLGNDPIPKPFGSNGQVVEYRRDDDKDTSPYITTVSLVQQRVLPTLAEKMLSSRAHAAVNLLLRNDEKPSRWQVTTRFDWKVVDSVSMPNGLTVGRLWGPRGEDDCQPTSLRFMAPACPPYKELAAQKCADVVHQSCDISGDIARPLYWHCDAIPENVGGPAFAVPNSIIASPSSTRDVRCLNHATLSFFVPTYCDRPDADAIYRARSAATPKSMRGSPVDDGTARPGILESDGEDATGVPMRRASIADWETGSSASESDGPPLMREDTAEGLGDHW